MTSHRLLHAAHPLGRILLVAFLVIASALRVPSARADHDDDACLDEHVNGGQDLTDIEVTVKNTGQPVYDGMILPKFTQIQVHAEASAYGHCQIWHSFGDECTKGLRFERNVNHMALWEATDRWASERRSMTAAPNNQYYNVLDTNDPTTSGPMSTSLFVVGPTHWEFRNVINYTICKINPKSVSKFMKVFVRDESKDENLGCNNTEGNPCNVTTGNKYQKEVDLANSALPIVRHYNSKLSDADFGLGNGWLTRYHRRLQILLTTTGATARHRHEDGWAELFTRTGTGPWTRESDSTSTITEDTTGYTVAYLRRSRDRYDLVGRLTEMTDESGATFTLTYDTNGRLSEVSSAFGHELLFVYDANGRVASIGTGVSTVASYQYDAEGNVTRVTRPDASFREYLYEDSAFPRYLTGIRDEGGMRWGTYTYDSSGRVTASQHPLGAGNISLAYTSSTATAVTDALGVTRTFSHSSVKGAARITGLTGSSCSWCKPSKATTYDVNANVTARTDWLNQKTCYAYNTARNLETYRLEGLAPGLNCPANLATYTPTTGTRQRKIATQWHSTLPLPSQIDEPGRRTTYTYDAAGNQLTRTETDTATSASRVWTFTYDSSNRMLTANGPRTDVADTTTYAYYSCATGSECGQLHTVTNAAGHITTYSTYNAHAQPLTITDPNGVVTTLAYDSRNRLTSETVGGEQTLFDYWPTSTLKKTTLPDGSYINYTYDIAHRLTNITDSAGNSIVYTLDAMGNRTAEQIYDPASTLTQAQSRVYNTANRLSQSIGAAGTSAVTTTYSYDNNGNQTSIAAPLSRNTSHTYDELNRLTQVTDPLSGITQYGYNPLDQLIAVTDPRGKVTSYIYNALGDLTQLISPDTGTTANTHDSGGNVSTSTDSRSKTATLSYDALNRVTGVSYPDQTITFTYDTGTNQNGRLTQVSDNSGSTSWTYDPRGRVLTKQQSMGVAKTVGYAYDSSGRLQSLTLPSGNAVAYGYTDGKVTSLTLNSSTTILSGVLYQPFRGTRGWTWGNSTLAIREYDTDGKITDIDSAGLRTYGYDDAFRITSLTDASNAALSQSYDYDLLDRLTSATGTGLDQSWTYDANGNRLTQGGSASSSYTISATNNRLTGVSGAVSRSYTYDNAGNTAADGTSTFIYNDAGRMISATRSGVTTTFALNALGQRVKKTTSGASRYFVYDEAGHLIGEYDNSGVLIQEIVWFGDIPVATIQPNGVGVDLFYIHSDHLNTPRQITRPSDNVVVWRWDSAPFGTAAANEDPDADSVPFVFQLRFAGQYFDEESGLHHNYFRDYDPAIGRYVQSDPIGLTAGLNTYAYVNNSPTRYMDSLGLQSFDPGAPPQDPTPRNRDPRTPWIPRHWQNRSNNCAPYYKTSASSGGVSNVGLIPLVSEEIKEETDCKLVVLCSYKGFITVAKNWDTGDSQGEWAEITIQRTIPKEEGVCCGK